MIEAGQIYEYADEREGGRRIRVTEYTLWDARAHVVSHPSGTHARQILAKDLHESATTKTGKRRRTGYFLVADPETS